MGNRYNYKHGLYQSRLYNIWRHIKSRCNNKNDAKYKDYGGRGIKLCDEWFDFKSFHDWAVSSGYDESLEIDRVDNDGNYSPYNCRWVTRKTQCNNLRRNHLLTYDGETRTMQEWGELLGVNVSTMSTRAWRGWSDKEILFGRSI